jgi:DNA-binding MarR family transcriptional regulator
MHHTDIERLSLILIELYEKMSSWEHAVVKESGLTPAQMHTIEILGHQESLRMKELAQKLGVTTGTLTVMIDRLEQNGLISRKPNEDDRRSIVVVLTKKGQKYFEEHHKLHLELTQEITSSLTKDEAKQLYTFMEKLVSFL